jgi:hypothetical protein
MALVSPGTEITIVDQSQYLPAAPASVPLIFLATAENKSNAAGTGIAPGTIAANANKLYRVTSQRDLVTLFGNPFFYKTTNGTPIQGYELNEYGLLTAYSVLGTTNLCYVVRSNIDLGSLVGKTGRPSGEPFDGTYWVDTTTSTWGIFEFNQSTGNFTSKTPIVLTDSSDFAAISGQPLDSIGNIGDYCISFVTDSYGYATVGAPSSYNTYWYKNKSNDWVAVGGTDWKLSLPTVQGTNTPSSLSASGSLVINSTTVALSAGNTVTAVASAINAANIPFVSAAAVNGRLEMYLTYGSSIVIGSATTPAILSDLGLTAKTYYGVTLEYGTNAQQPRWRVTDAEPHPTGSVWIKTNSANRGASIVISQYDGATATYDTKLCPLNVNDWTATLALDPTGGKNIPEGTLYAKYNSDTSAGIDPIQIFGRYTSGPSIFVGTTTAPTFANGATFYVRVSVPDTNTLSSEYVVTMPGSGVLGAPEFVTAWTAANIPNTTAEVSVTGAIVLTHTEGGEIILDDRGVTSPASAVSAAGFAVGSTQGAKWGIPKTLVYTGLTSSGGSGSGATFNVTTSGYIPSFTLVGGGTGYAVGDIVTVNGGSPLSASYRLKVASVSAGVIQTFQWLSGYANPSYTVQLSNWRILLYIPNDIAPTVYPTNGTPWYYSVVNQVDIMTNVGGVWKGYRNISYASNGLPQNVGTPATDPNGPIISASVPETQSDGTALVYGDLWIDSNDLENYPVISRWQQVDGVDQWVLIDNTDQQTETGIVFADARWAAAGTVDPIDDAIPSIVTLLTSDYLDLDAPDPALYPQGTLLFNTRRSGYNVKEFRLNYFNNKDFPDAPSLPQEKSTWVSVSGNQTNGAPYMGRKAQRAIIVRALKETVNTNAQIREEDTFFNLIAAPNYCELQPDMVTLNNDRNNTAYIVGDTPLRLAANAQDITDWATNAAGATTTGENGLVTRNTYLGIYYPSGITTDLTGTEVVVPSSHMILRTMIYNDNVAYPWFAPAGQRRGIIDNATNIGYLDGASGEFVTDKNRVQLRDVEYTNFINPIAYFTNIGLLNYGNKNSFDSQSSLDRTNVARLICYIRERLQQAMRPFIFEPNDTITRAEVTGVVQTLMNDILAKRGIYDYLVVCDTSNNTPARIDRNELWVDIAIEPVKAIEFIYIPIRILNTGEVAGLAQNG